MKKFENPEILVEELELVDIVTTSECPEETAYACPNDLGVG